MTNIHDLIGREIKIDSKEGEITKILGVNFAEITFFNINDGKISIEIKEIDKYLV